VSKTSSEGRYLPSDDVGVHAHRDHLFLGGPKQALKVSLLAQPSELENGPPIGLTRLFEVLSLLPVPSGFDDVTSTR
jgi:hypothetical protein